MGEEATDRKRLVSALSITISENIWEQLEKFRAESEGDVKADVIVRYGEKGVVMGMEAFLRALGLWKGEREDAVKEGFVKEDDQ